MNDFIDTDPTLALLQEIRDLLARPKLHERLALSDREVADALGISPRTLWSRVSEGLFPKPIIWGGLRRWPLDVVKQWLAKQTEGAAR